MLVPEGVPGILVQSAWCSVIIQLLYAPCGGPRCDSKGVPGKSPKRETGAGLVDGLLAELLLSTPSA